MTAPHPTDDEAVRLAVIHQTLAHLGVAPDGGAYDFSLLAAAVYAHGWSYRIDRGAGEFHATITRSRDGQRQFQAAANGSSMDAALAGALANALTSKAAF